MRVPGCDRCQTELPREAISAVYCSFKQLKNNFLQRERVVCMNEGMVFWHVGRRGFILEDHEKWIQKDWEIIFLSQAKRWMSRSRGKARTLPRQAQWSLPWPCQPPLLALFLWALICCGAAPCVQLSVPCDVSGSGVLAPKNKVVSFLRAGRSHALSFFMYFCSALHTALLASVSWVVDGMEELCG